MYAQKDFIKMMQEVQFVLNVRPDNINSNVVKVIVKIVRLVCTYRPQK